MNLKRDSMSTMYIWAKKILPYVLIATGTMLVSVAFNVFLNANHVLVSGIGGVAILISYLSHAPLGVVYLILNIPLFLGGWRYVSFSFFLKSIWGTATLSMFLILTRNTPIYHELFSAALLGGAISGIAIGIVLLAGGTTGGTDIISVIVNQRSHWSVGRIMFIVNSFIILCGVLLFGIGKALLTVASLYVTSMCVNIVLKVGGWERRNVRNEVKQNSVRP